MLFHCHLEILNHFWKGPLLLFVLGPARYVAGPDPWIEPYLKLHTPCWVFVWLVGWVLFVLVLQPSKFLLGILSFETYRALITVWGPSWKH